MKPIKLTCELLGAAGMVSELVPVKYTLRDIARTIRNQLYPIKRHQIATFDNNRLTLIRNNIVSGIV